MTSESSDPWDDYARAVIWIDAPGGPVRVLPAPAAVTIGRYPDPRGRTICVITACNPRGPTVTDRENAEAQDKLQETIAGRGWERWAAAGGDRAWTHVEQSVAVAGADEAEVAALGAAFRQGSGTCALLLRAVGTGAGGRNEPGSS